MAERAELATVDVEVRSEEPLCQRNVEAMRLVKRAVSRCGEMCQQTKKLGAECVVHRNGSAMVGGDLRSVIAR